MIGAKKVAVFVALLSVLTCPPDCSAWSRIDTWTQMDVQCLPETAAAFSLSVSRSELQCVISASSVLGLIVVQFDRLSLICRLFRFQSVCRLMEAGRSADCSVFIRFPIKSQSISSKLSSVWLGDSVSRFDNLVCQIDADTNRFYAVGGVQWTSEYGAQFDGRTGYLIVRKGNTDFIGGLTWLLRLKRNPQVQSYLGFVDCADINATTYTGYTDFWEYDKISAMYILTDHFRNISAFGYYTTAVLTNNSEEWIDIGFSTGRSSSAYGFYYNGSNLANSSVTRVIATLGSIFSSTCLYFGWRYGSADYRFNGTLRAIGLANASMTEREMQEFFALMK